MFRRGIEIIKILNLDLKNSLFNRSFITTRIPYIVARYLYLYKKYTVGIPLGAL